ncbi:helix-turn-helix domain-containing protein [Arthrobacter castelli]|uniref:helix-turn-helix domain-containing protein n=1 Tax=Arthrobacter castelli TaxID=271431 RepID=UPI0003FB2C67|nr:transcriptional regulator [Arthrobacter castelli]
MTLAQRLEHLFAETAGPGGRPVTLQEIIHRMEQRNISTMSLSYLQQLRSGQALNPRLQHLRALADAFDVPLSYFFDEDAPSAQAQNELTPEERKIAMRVHGLSGEALSSINSIVEFARKREQLDDPPGPSEEQ